MGWRVEHGDCREVMRTLPDASVDSGVLDPPYGLGFMGAEWDKFGGGRGMKAETIAAQKAAEERNEPFGRSGKPAKPAQGEKAGFKAFMGEVAAEYLRVLRPGAHVAVFGGTRTYHWMVDAWEDAGFEVRDQLLWLYGQGFPKGVNVAKAIALSMGVQPVAMAPATLGMANNANWNELKKQRVMPAFETWPEDVQQAALPWLGWNTALKPSVEPIMLARKPPEGTIHDSVLDYGTGGLNIDGCAIGGSGVPLAPGDYWLPKGEGVRGKTNPSGRWPANVLLDPEAARLLDEQTGVQRDGVAVKRHGKGGRFFGQEDGTKLGGAPDRDQGYGGKGGASRFFYCAKPSKREKNAGLDAFEAVGAAELTGRKEGSAGLVMQHADGRAKANPFAGTSGAVPRKNPHPTVKPIRLLRWLSRLVTPPGGTILDAFCGSGSGGCAAVQEGLDYIGIELDPEGKGFVDIARARIAHHAPEPAPVLDPLAAFVMEDF